MKAKFITLITLTLILSSLLISSINVSSADENNAENNQWDFVGVFRKDSEVFRFVVYKPELMDYTTPTINKLQDITIEYNTTGNVISWFVNDPYPGNFPANYTINKDNELLVKGQQWASNSYITVNIGNLTLGTHNYSLFIQDEKGHITEDTVNVNVVDEAAPYISQLANIVVYEGDGVNHLQWYVSDNNLSSFKILLDDGMVDSGEWNSTRWNNERPYITYNINELSVGTHNVTLVVKDGYDHESSDNVIVTVKNADEKIDYTKYSVPSLELGILALDTDGDQSMDTYFGFFGLIEINLNISKYFSEFLSPGSPSLGATCRFRIPENSSASWKVLYYPDSLYLRVRDNLQHAAPIYYVNLTETTGAVLEYEIDTGSNTTFGYIASYSSGAELFPDYPEFPGFHFAIPYKLGTRENEIPTKTPFFGSLQDMVGIVTVAFVTLYMYKKIKTKRKKV